MLAMAPSVLAAAGPPVAASGVWSWVNTGWDPYKEAGSCPPCNVFSNGSEDATWTGTLVGHSTDTFRVVQTRSGALWAQLPIAFEGSVGGETGTLDIMAIARMPVGAPTMTGTWVIVGGTGELVNLHGHGTWTYNGVVGNVNSADYLGEVKFAP